MCPRPDSSQELDQLIERAYISLLSSCSADPVQWRRLYSDASVLRSLMDLISPQALDEDSAMSCVSRLDHALIIAGAPGQDIQSLIQDLIQRTQATYLPRKSMYSPKPAIRPTRSSSAHIPVLSTSSGTIPRLVNPPSLSVFRHELFNKPFILTGFASDWPAMNEHPWHSFDYLRYVAGRGRVVPVEVGKDYRTDDWTQRMMSWDDFLDVLGKDPTHSQTILYMAQHNLLSQFHALREDILIPDYVFTSPEAPATYPFYRPPNNEEGLALNAWLGPPGTASPAHTVCPILLLDLKLLSQRGAQDPFFNLYSKRSCILVPARNVPLGALPYADLLEAQVVGRKTVWLAPPTPVVTKAMYPFPPTSVKSEAERTRNPAANLLAPSMTNTAQVDVFSDQNKNKFPLFWRDAVPEALSTTLEPGDVLFFPPGWWHAMKSEEMSFSVSIWF
jgi:hypothetical protein